MEEKVYTVKEVCKLLKVTRQTLSKLERNGTLLPFRIGINIRYRKEDIDEIIKGENNE